MGIESSGDIPQQNWGGLNDEQGDAPYEAPITDELDFREFEGTFDGDMSDGQANTDGQAAYEDTGIISEEYPARPDVDDGPDPRTEALAARLKDIAEGMPFPRFYDSLGLTPAALDAIGTAYQEEQERIRTAAEEKAERLLRQKPDAPTEHGQ